MTASNTSILLYSALCFGFSLAVNAWVFFRVSGGLFNPAVGEPTLTNDFMSNPNYIIGDVSNGCGGSNVPLQVKNHAHICAPIDNRLPKTLVNLIFIFRGVCIFISQVIGAIVAAAIISALLPGELTVRTTLTGKLIAILCVKAYTSLPWQCTENRLPTKTLWILGTSVVRGLFIEMFCTSLLVFTILMLAVEVIICYRPFIMKVFLPENNPLFCKSRNIEQLLLHLSGLV